LFQRWPSSSSFRTTTDTRFQNNGYFDSG
jgi:hypothetical protein